MPAPSEPPADLARVCSRTTFLERIAHDLRGPAGVAVGALDEIERTLGTEAEQARPFLLMAQRGLGRILRLADGLQRTAYLEGQSVGGAQAPTELRHVVAGATRDAEGIEVRRTVIQAGHCCCTRGMTMSELDYPRLRGIRVLVVDDDADSREMIAMAFERSGARTVLAESAADALSAFDKERPDVVLLDLSLPDEDGFCLLRRLRDRPASDGKDVLAIALTGYGSPEDRERTRGAGFQAHLVKPIGLSDTVALVASLLQSRPSRSLG